MKKNKLINLLKFGILFFGISLFLFSCEKEEIIPIEVSSEIIPQQRTLSEAKKDKDFIILSEKFKLNPYLNENGFAKKSEEFTIDFSNFYEIKKENYTSYTFLLKRNNKDKSITENLVVEKKNDTVRGYIVKYSDIFYKKSGTNLFLNVKTSRTYFKGNIEELLEQNNIEFHNKEGWSCSWNTTYTPRNCSEHGSFVEGTDTTCPNRDKSNWTSSSYQTCSYSSAEPNLSESSGNEIDFSYGGGSRGYDGSETVPIIPCANGDESFQNKSTASDCIEILEEEEDEQIINELTGKAECTYGKMKNINLLKKTLEKFNGVKAPVHLVLSEKSNLKDKNGNLLNGLTEYGNSFYIKITLNKETSNERPSLSVVRTILHESIHAEIFRKIKSTSNDISKVIIGEISWPTLFNYYNEDKKNAQHNFIADYYRNAIEIGLKEYATSIGKTYPEQLYKDLSWVGLQGTKAWTNMFADPIFTKNEQERIKKSISDFNKTSKNECI